MRTNLIKPKIDSSEKAVTSSDGKLDMVIAFDTTGSMSHYIESVKNHIKELTKKLFDSNPNLRLGVVAFGDYCDMLSKSDYGNAYQVLNLTNNIQDIITFVNNAKYTSGGDSDEFYELVIRKIVEETNWRKNSTKVVLLIADSTPHEVGYSYLNIVTDNQIDWREEAHKAANKGIKFDTLTIRPAYSKWYKELSKITNGVSVPFSSSNKTSHLIEAAAMSRGSKVAKEIFYATMDSYIQGSDEEMKAVYSAYQKTIIP